MKGAFGHLGWTPEVFWRSTVTEYMLAIAGYNEKNGAESDKDKGPSDDDLAALVARYG
jgi:hypothetical protein